MKISLFRKILFAVAVLVAGLVWIPALKGILASEPGLAAFGADHPRVRVYCAAVDPELNDAGYIVPGLGDAGDRLFGPPD